MTKSVKFLINYIGKPSASLYNNIITLSMGAESNTYKIIQKYRT